MLLDATTIADGSEQAADICIIGAGAAGITLARELAGSRRVLLIESGGLEATPAVQALYTGSVSGDIWQLLAPQQGSDTDYLQRSRQRYLGGSTNCWFGVCRPLDASVFSPRPWLSRTAWPFGCESLDDYYRKAADVCGIGAEYSDFYRDDGRRFSGDVRFVPAREIRSPALRFGSFYRDELRDSERVQLFVGATVTDIACKPSGDAVDYITVATLAGNRFRVNADTYVLATGSIENARLLLSSSSVHENGIGNSSDQLGRNFMDHLYPKLKPGLAVLSRTRWEGRDDYDDFGIWMLDRSLRQQHGLLNVGLAFEPQKHSREEIDPHMLSTARVVDGFGTGDNEARDSFMVSLRLHVELEPDAENRITLGDEVDAVGMRKVHLHWRMTDRDRYSISKSLQLFSAELGRNLSGRMAAGKPAFNSAWGPHHMGTTRMSAVPADGVVDPQGRVHDVANLYVAGSSVFPSAGFENPTFTIIALALRMADHLKGLSG